MTNIPLSTQITTLTLFKYQGIRNKVWAFGMMQFAHKYLVGVKGLQFYKLMGSGKGLGFNPLPDWGVYAMLQTWETESDARAFFAEAPLVNRYKKRSKKQITYYLKNIAAHGLWSGQQPFSRSSTLKGSDTQIAVITRATIKTSQLIRFWKYVPTAQEPIKDAKGLIYTKGIGEVPIKHMATFSVWENLDAVKAYAYQSKEHATAIKMTKQYDWYSEELFSRFEVIDTVGSW